MKRKHFRVENDEQKIIANIELLTDEELNVIEKYRKLGYTVVNGKISVEKPKGKKRLTEGYIRNYLKDNEDALKKFDDVINEPAIDNNGNIKKTTTGKIRLKGFNAGRNWFAKNFPEDLSSLKFTKTQEAALKTAWENYSKAESPEMDKDEYKRYYYWTKIFEDK